MKSVTINPNDKKQYESSLQLMKDFGIKREEVVWDDEKLSFIFLKNVATDLDEILSKEKTKKGTR